MIDPPKFSHLGHHLINKNGIGHCRKPFEWFNHVFLPMEPRFEIIDAACWPLNPQRPNEGLGDIDHEQGEIGTMINRLFIDVHEVFESPLLFRVSKIALPLEAPPLIVASWIIPQRQVTTTEYYRRCWGGLPIRFDEHDHRKQVGNLLMPQSQLVYAGLSLFVDTRGLQVL
jgi:hypothetical protein